MKKLNQNQDVYIDLTTTGKSLLQLYIELKDKYNKLVNKELK